MTKIRAGMSVNLWRYAGVYCAVLFGLAALSFLLGALLNLSVPSGLSIALPPMIAALREGRDYTRKTGAVIEKGPAWRVAFAMTGVVAVINVLFFIGLSFIPELREVMQVVSVAILLVVFVALLGVVLLANRYFLLLGMRKALKVIAERSEKVG